MVAINRYILIFCALLASVTISWAQELKPRIAGLETNSDYMALLEQDLALTEQEDSVMVVLSALRESLRNSSAKINENREQIIASENILFDLRRRKAQVVDSLNEIEQNWVLNSVGRAQQSQPTLKEETTAVKDVNAKHIFQSRDVAARLSPSDYNNLANAETKEPLAEELSDRYIVNYDNLLSLRRSYESVAAESEAQIIKERFDSLQLANVEILSHLSDTWGYIYDNKSFAYSLLMELLGFDDMLEQESELMRQAQAEISAKQGVGAADELLRYRIQKSSMVEFEQLVASRLGLAFAEDSLKVVTGKLSAVEKISPAEITIEPRLFIDYEPIEFTAKPIYNKSNPIPHTVIYDKGVIFRLYVGSFQNEPTVATFRNATPLSHLMNDKKRHCYYIGGYATYEQALEAQALLKSRGFRAPQIVVWSDGKERNLTTDPLPMEISMRIEISDVPVLPDGAMELVGRVAKGSSISKVGTDKFVIMSLERESQVDSLVSGLKSLDAALKINVEKSEMKFEF